MQYNLKKYGVLESFDHNSRSKFVDSFTFGILVLIFHSSVVNNVLCLKFDVDMTLHYKSFLIMQHISFIAWSIIKFVQQL